MKKVWLIIVFGIVLILISPKFMYNGIYLKPMLDSNGQQIIKDGRVVYKEDKIRTAIRNRGYWFCFLGGITCILIGTTISLKRKNEF